LGILDWAILILFFAYTLWDGIRHNIGAKSVEDLLLAGRRMPGWAIGISVLATQASAITFIGTTGQAYMHDMKFVQFYLGTPLAMVLLCVTLLPIYYRSRAYTAYEVLERRFGLSTRLATSLLFLISRGLAMGVTIAAPAYVLALILEVPLSTTIVIIGISATFYTMFGGIGGVIRTDVKQMFLMLLGLGLCFGWIIGKMPEGIGMGESLQIAGALGKLETIDFRFDVSEKYNFWSGIIAGTFLMISYFGTDQSQVQRYLTSRSLADARASLLLPAMVKIPMQFFVLLLGACLYVFYFFGDRPLLFTPLTSPAEQQQVQPLEEAFQELQLQRQQAAYRYLADPQLTHRQQLNSLDNQAHLLREEALIQLQTLSKADRDDTNYVLPYFILHELPVGLIGIIIAAILAAALSSIDSILNSLTAATVMDWYQRIPGRRKSDRHHLRVARLFTLFWGIMATLSALALGETESIIELVNKIGSYFYGSLLGVFVLIWIKRSTSGSALLGLVLGISSVFVLSLLHRELGGEGYAWFFETPKGYERVLEYLWLNPIGTAVVVLVGWLGGKRR
jgi:Na+/proline symporter